ncbi:MAG: hypothetical protein R6V58_02560 [Planctomycetota bacterium]
MTMRLPGLIGLVAMALTAGAARADFELPLTLRETRGAGGTTYVSNGVPLLAGQAMSTGELHVVGPDGEEVPAQFRVLARWWRTDNSIRWVLVDFIGNVPTGGVAAYQLVGRKAKAARPATPLAVTETDDAIGVNTGPALYRISKTHFNLIDKLQIDKNADGDFAESETVVFPNPKHGSVVEDPAGRKYYSSQGTRFVKFIDRGPVRVTLLAKGTHVSDEDGALQPCLYGFEVFMTFHADRPYVDVDAILTNNFEEPIGEPHIEDWSIVTNVGGPDAGGAGCNVWTKGYVNAGCPTDGSVVIYQDSLGTNDWARLPGVEPRAHGLQRFRGYKVWQVGADGKKKELDSGDFATACGQYGRSNLGCVLAPKYFWQQFPSAIEYRQDGTLRYSMFPREHKQVHWLEDGSAKGMEFRLHYYIKMAKRRFTAFAGNHRPWAHVVYDNYLSTPWALPPVEHCGKCGALHDLGPYKMDDRVPVIGFPLERRDRRSMMTDYLKGNGYGWQAFGTRWEELAGHSPWNYEPIWTSCSLFNYLVTRRVNWKTYGLRVARQARDVRAYLIDDQDNLALWWTRGGKYQRHCVFESFSRRTPKTGKHPYRRRRWPLPNQAHLNLDEVHDLYLMTGDDRARRCMEMIACHGAYTATRMRRYARPSRAEGWCLRVLMRYYGLTGDERFKPFVEQAIDKCWREINKAGTQGGTWYGGVFGRGVIAAYLATGDERMRDVAIGHADWARTYEVGTEGYPYHTVKQGPYNVKPSERGNHCPWANAYLIDVHAFAYEQTGDPAYKEAMEFAWEKLDPRDGKFLMFLPAAVRRVYGPRADKKPPAAVEDLKAEALGGGKVRLTWTASGDDEKTGTAAVYQIKVATKPILEFVPWPEKKDTHVAFWGAENVPDEPQPKRAGTKQTYTFKDLKPGTVWFAIKSRDELDNQSAISNVVKLELK